MTKDENDKRQQNPENNQKQEDKWNINEDAGEEGTNSANPKQVGSPSMQQRRSRRDREAGGTQQPVLVHVERLLKEAGLTNFTDIQKIGLFQYNRGRQQKREEPD